MARAAHPRRRPRGSAAGRWRGTGALASSPDRIDALGRIVATVNAEADAHGREAGPATRPGNAFVGCLTFDPRPRQLSAGTLAIEP